MTRTCSDPICRRTWTLLFLAMVLAAPPLLLSAPPVRAATITVTTAGDAPDIAPNDGVCDAATGPGAPCSLRAAIQTANATPGVDTIAFNIPGDRNVVKVIQPNHPATPGGPHGPLPPMTEQVTIDGYTQPGSRVNTATFGTNAKLRIELDGSFTSSAHGLKVNPDATNTVIRGVAIGGFDFAGIYVLSADDVRITGCFLGVNADGTAARPNAFGLLAFESDVVIGGSVPAARNLLSGNSGNGVALNQTENSALVLGNLIGTTKTGTAPLGNAGDGVVVYRGDVTIGGAAAAEANVIAFNGDDGVHVFSTVTRILRNSIFTNARQGIDLDPNGRDANDEGDGDLDGGNNLQNHPVITVATTDLVRITFNSTPSQNFTVRLYSNPGSGDEGRAYHGTFGVSTDGTGNTNGAENDLVPTPPIPAGRSVTATATDAAGNTSEFSARVAVTAG